MKKTMLFGMIAVLSLSAASIASAADFNQDGTIKNLQPITARTNLTVRTINQSEAEAAGLGAGGGNEFKGLDLRYVSLDQKGYVENNGSVFAETNVSAGDLNGGLTANIGGNGTNKDISADLSASFDSKTRVSATAVGGQFKNVAEVKGVKN